MPCRYINGSTSATFGRLARPRRQDRAAEPAPLARASSTRRSFTRGARHLDRPRRRRDRARLGVPVAHHQPTAPLVTLAGQRRRCRRPPRPRARPPASGGHPPGRSHPAPQRISAAALVIGHYSQHRRSFLAGAANAGSSSFWFNEEGTPRPRTDRPIHRFRSYLRRAADPAHSLVGDQCTLAPLLVTVASSHLRIRWIGLPPGKLVVETAGCAALLPAPHPDTDRA